MSCRGLFRTERLVEHETCGLVFALENIEPDVPGFADRGKMVFTARLDKTSHVFGLYLYMYTRGYHDFCDRIGVIPYTCSLFSSAAA